MVEKVVTRLNIFFYFYLFLQKFFWCIHRFLAPVYPQQLDPIEYIRDKGYFQYNYIENEAYKRPLEKASAG